MIDESSASEAIGAHFYDAFGVQVEISPLPGERDRNFKISSQGKNAVLKFCSPEELEHLQLQDRVLRALSLPSVPTVLHDDQIRWPSGEIVRLMSWVDGTPWAEVAITEPLLVTLGMTVAQVDAQLSRIVLSPSEQTVLARPFRWNLLQAGDLRGEVELITDPELRAICRSELDTFVEEIAPALAALPHHLIHNDANERNIIVDGEQVSLIDFGDLVVAPRVVGLATALAYAASTMADPARESRALVRGYHAVQPLTPEELALLWPLTRIRLVMSVVNAAAQSAADPDNEYLLISQDTVPTLLRKLVEADDYLGLCRLREACGYEPSPRAHDVRSHLRSVSASPVVSRHDGQHAWIDWSVGSASPRDEAGVRDLMRDRGLDVLAGRYAENRDVYIGASFEDEQRSVHLGLDLFQPAGSIVHAPLAGVVEDSGAMPGAGNYGHAVVLRHQTPAGTPFWTLYGHLSATGFPQPGDLISAGDTIGTMGEPHENGGWPPHVHFQVLTDLCGMGMDIYGVAPQHEATLWRSICPNPNLLVGLADADGLASDGHAGLPQPELLRQRRARLSRNLSLNFREPLHIVRGEGAYLYDAEGKSFLDLVNNVAHVGHGNPHVVAAGAQQMHLLNTNTRYLHDAIIEYARNLTATLPDPLSVVFLVNSGSEANDLAIRLARAHTNAEGWISLRHAYHGHTVSVVDISPYKFLGPGGAGPAPHVRVADLPDAFRGRHTDPGAGLRYATDFAQVLEDLEQPIAGFIAEGIVSTAGQVTLADGFLARAYEHVRAAGGVCIADEVQIGLGRVGSAFWGFELHGVVPDIVTMGKPLGNGHPLAAVVTTPQIAHSFNNGMEYFNTFGGNPVSATIGQAVLDVVLDSRLQAHADQLGSYVKEQVRHIQGSHPLIADVRGHGLFLGIELMRGDEPAGDAVAEVIEYAKQRGVLLSSDGPDNNVFKIKPPMVVQREDMDFFLEVFSEALSHVE